jgi:hypothetical protein
VNELSEFERRLAEKEAAAAARSAAAEPAKVNWDEFVPEVDVSISEEDQALDDAIQAIGIVEGYNRWCKKMRPDTRSGRMKEGIKVSCPNPAHPDTRPSAWLNTEKNLYFCPGCSQGGDIWDMAAWWYGMSVPWYKKDRIQFRELREKIGAELGFTTVKGLTQTFLLPPTAPEEQTVVADPVTTEPVAAPVGMLPSGVAHEQAKQAGEQKAGNPANIDWRSIVPTDTFLRSWLESTTIDDCPEEYHFWTGLMAIGFAVGRNRVLDDFRPVAPNLFVCFVGPSGAGKSTAKAHLVKIVQDVMPYNYEDPLTTGTKHLSSPGSAEYIVKSFSAPIPDPAAPKKILGYMPVRMQIDFEELSSLVGISGRMGSTMKPVLLEIYDGQGIIGSGSLTHGDRVARDPFGQVTTTTQDGSLNKLLSKSDEVSGFMNRWIFASGKLKRQRSLGGAAIDFTDPSARLKAIHTWAGKAVAMKMTPDAYTRWDEFFHETLVPTKTSSESSGSALLNRIDLLYKKLMVLLSCNMMETEISLAAVDQAITLFPYLLRTYGIVSSEMEATEESAINNTILDAIVKFTLANGKGPTLRELYPTVKKLGSQKAILETVKNMTQLGLIAEAPTPAGSRGRPTVRYIVNE